MAKFDDKISHLISQQAPDFVLDDHPYFLEFVKAYYTFMESADQLVEAVQEEIDMINLGGPIAVVECKKLVRRVPQLSIEEGFKETAEWSGRMFRSDEASEGMAAFREKRNAAWVKD